MAKPKRRPRRKPKTARPASWRDALITKPVTAEHCITKLFPRGITKTVATVVRQIGDGEGRRLIRFIASSEAVDLQGEVIRAAGIDTGYFFRRGGIGPLLLDHDHTRPVGVVHRLDVENLADGTPALLGLGEFDGPGTSSSSDEAWRQVKTGSRNGISISFIPLDPSREQAERIRMSGRGVVFEAVQLIEISIVSTPACGDCQILETGTEVRSIPDTPDKLLAEIDKANVIVKTLEDREERERAEQRTESAIQWVETYCRLKGWI